MMTISLNDAGKRFNREWIFRHLSYRFDTGNAYAITGPNGSGKSTLLQAIAGSISLNEGKLEFTNDQPQDPENIYQYISIAAPYLELIEEMTASEFLGFHAQFKPLLKPAKDILSFIHLDHAAEKQIRYYSSGMKQRMKLAQAIFSDVPAVLLDEPCTNLDAEGIALYQQLIGQFCKDRLVIVSSNDEQEYRFCQKKINIIDHK